MSEQAVELQCEKCGATFVGFLKEMAARNLKVVCPKCAASENCAAPGQAAGLKH